MDEKNFVTGDKNEMSITEIAKRQLERDLGISYSEFEMLDIDEQRKLMNKKRRKKIKLDSTLYIDGVPVGEIQTKVDVKRLVKGIFKRK